MVARVPRWLLGPLLGYTGWLLGLLLRVPRMVAKVAMWLLGYLGGLLGCC